MFDTAKAIVKSSIREKYPEISRQEMRVKIFLRFYGQDFDAKHCQAIKAVLENEA
jgi:hypothetical protein